MMPAAEPLLQESVGASYSIDIPIAPDLTVSLRYLWLSLRQYALKLTAIVVCFLCISAITPEEARAFTIYNESGSGVNIKAKVLEGDFEKDINPGGNASCHWTNRDCNPSGQRSAILTTQIETDNFKCIVKMPAGGYTLLRAWDRSKLGLPKDFACQGFDWNNNAIESVPYNIISRRDIRFLATADPQYYKSDSYEKRNKVADRTLSEMKKQQQRDRKVRGILVAGDLTQNTRHQEWDRYEAQIKAISHYVYDGMGNHDYHTAFGVADINCLFDSNCTNHNTIKDGVTKRKHITPPTNSQGPHYSWDWQDVHFVQLNLFPGNEASPAEPDMNPYSSLDFLKADLKRYVGSSGRPVVIVQHYGFDNQISTSARNWWTQEQRKAYWDAIAPYNVTAIFTGHYHPTPNGHWYHPWSRPAGSSSGPEMIPTYTAGAACNGAYLDVQLTNDKMVVSRIDATQGSRVVGKSEVSLVSPMF